MIKTILLNIFFVSTFVIASAQTESWPKFKSLNDRANEQTNKMKLKLQLTPKQMEEVFIINFNMDNKYNLLIQNQDGNDRKFQRSINNIGIQRDSLMEGVLTDAQFFQYRKMR